MNNVLNKIVLFLISISIISCSFFSSKEELSFNLFEIESNVSINEILKLEKVKVDIPMYSFILNDSIKGAYELDFQEKIMSKKWIISYSKPINKLFNRNTKLYINEGFCMSTDCLGKLLNGENVLFRAKNRYFKGSLDLEDSTKVFISYGYGE